VSGIVRNRSALGPVALVTVVRFLEQFLDFVLSRPTVDAFVDGLDLGLYPSSS